MSERIRLTEIRENIEWVSFRWHNEPDHVLPRVLLVGDSIVVGHGAKVHGLLKDSVCVDYFATSKHVTDKEFMSDLDLMLSRRRHELILFNNGLHGFEIDDALYPPALRSVLQTLRGRTPRLAWRNSTPVLAGPGSAELGERNARVVQRNAAALTVAQALGLPVMDLYTPMVERRDLISDGVHCTDAGSSFQAELIAAFIRGQLR